MEYLDDNDLTQEIAATLKLSQMPPQGGAGRPPSISTCPRPRMGENLKIEEELLATRPPNDPGEFRGCPNVTDKLLLGPTLAEVGQILADVGHRLTELV